MSYRTTQAQPLRELNHRHSSGIDVTLFWDQDRERLLVCVCDARSGDYFVLQVAHAEALNAFHHPYAYAAREGRPISPVLRPPAPTQPSYIGTR
jgi:hypothetical protein